MLVPTVVTLLSAISVLCFFATLWLAIAVVRRLRNRRNPLPEDRQSSAPREFFEGGEYRAPGTLRLIQQIDQKVSLRSASSTQRAAPAAGIAIQAQQAAASPGPGEPGFVERRKSRQPVPFGVSDRRADRTHYNKDMGDLSDPYTQPRAASDSGVRPAQSGTAQPRSAIRQGRSGLYLAVNQATRPAIHSATESVAQHGSPEQQGPAAKSRLV